VRVEEIGVDAPRCPNEACEQRRYEERKRRTAPQIAEHSVAVGKPVGAELLRADDLDVDTACAEVLDGVGDEVARRIVARARVGGREDCDAHQLWTR
jgi:hypothetical protein